MAGLMTKQNILDKKRRLISCMERAAVSSAQQMLKSIHSNDEVEVQLKSDRTIVLNLDLESQEVIKSILGETLPVISEEEEPSHALLGREKDYFLVDPLDGTTSCKRFMGVEGGQVGFGPIIGLVQNHRLAASVFYNLPTRTLFTALLGEGAFMCHTDLPSFEDLTPLELRKRLKVEAPKSLSQSAVLFDGRCDSEARFVEYLKRENMIETAYHFGGFGNDCSRLAQDLEQVLIRPLSRAWDLPAVLLPLEAGLDVIMDPLGAWMNFEQWRISDHNPVLIAHADVLKELQTKIKEVAQAESSSPAAGKK
jgi:3'-phosphoadenosine 5'-phosphosulfate (PAPS) 3'-phosphatase